MFNLKIQIKLKILFQTYFDSKEGVPDVDITTIIIISSTVGKICFISSEALEGELVFFRTCCFVNFISSIN